MWRWVPAVLALTLHHRQRGSRGFSEAVEAVVTRLRGGSSLAYEALDLVDGERSVAAVAADLSGIYGPVPQAEVEEFLESLRAIGLLER